MEHPFKFRLSLFILRITVFIVLFMWTLDKFFNPGHAASVYASFYYIEVPRLLMILIGAIELVIIIGFLLGLYKFFTYGIVLVIHAISTLSSFSQYFSPFEEPHLLFFAAWPMLGACFMLFVMRASDTLWIYKPKPGR